MTGTSTHTGPVPPLPAIEAPADLMAEARANCAARARARGQDAVAEAYETGAGDAGWGFRHEVAKLRAERRIARAAALDELMASDSDLIGEAPTGAPE